MSADKGPRVKFTIRMPRLLHDRLVKLAKEAGMTLNDFIIKQIDV